MAHGLANDLPERAADVMLKERRPLVLVPRETPLSLIHLRNLTAVAEAGAIVVPAMPAFYTKPEIHRRPGQLRRRQGPRRARGRA